MEQDPDQARWADASLVANLIAVDPVGLGGVCIRAGHGAARDFWLALLRAAVPRLEPIRRVPLHVSTDRLLGGLDLTATLSSGRPVAQRGVLAEADGGFVLLPMVERFLPSTLAHIVAALDTGEVVVERNGLCLRAPARLSVIALDEGIGEDEVARAELLDRLAFLVDFSGLRTPRATITALNAESVAEARSCLPRVRIDDDICEALCAAAMKLGIASIRASIMAVRAACALAAVSGRSQVDENDAATAARLVLASRATQLPDMPASDEPSAGQEAEQNADRPDPPGDQAPADDTANENGTDRTDSVPENMLLEAALAAIPKGLLARLQSANGLPSRARSDGRAGAFQQSLLRGRPAGVRRGEPRAGVRLNLIETLRAAAPWQALRRSVSSERSRRIEIRGEDFHVTRFRQRTQTTTIFIVDASGSSALGRMAEAKGAVELLLADCYVRRDQVAVIAFRGRTAELLLPPTRSLVRAKRNLAEMAGGAGTPLATAIEAGVVVAEQVRRAGQTPTVVLLTDGRANVALDGSGGRERAEADALASARRLRAKSIAVLFIDISPRAEPHAAQLAAEMNAHYIPLPYADAAMLSTAVKNMLPSARP